jgi:lipoate-protein ligase A
MIEVKSYDLKDYSIFDSDKESDSLIWQPDRTYIVLGRSNRVAEDSVHMDMARENGIAIYKRPSGGEAVILSPNTLVISVKLPLNNEIKTHHYFKLINSSIINALSEMGVIQLGNKGISDISIGMKKILGSSIYRKQKTLFYHAVLNISEPVENISLYLKHPKKEPDYRLGRKHEEFVTSLKNEGYSFSYNDLSAKIQESISALLSELSE